jgi:hypothetical protein
MTYDYEIRASEFTGLREAQDSAGRKAATFYTPAGEAIFIAGASAMRLSVYDADAEHGLCGTLDQVMQEGGE